jgi:hypothetical protein
METFQQMLILILVLTGDGVLSTLIEVHIDKKERKIYLKEHLYQKD